jgi:predicted Co/Zn/Cd cation transporter (cation efflux family)
MNSASGHGGLRASVTALAVAILALAVVIEATAGFRLGEAQGRIAELGVALAMIAASVLIFAQLGRSRRLLAALAAFGSVVIFWALNASFSTSLDVAHGGAYGWSGTRVMVLTLFVGPIIGFVAAILTFGFSHLSAFNAAAPKR